MQTQMGCAFGLELHVLQREAEIVVVSLASHLLHTILEAQAGIRRGGALELAVWKAVRREMRPRVA